MPIRCDREEHRFYVYPIDQRYVVWYDSQPLLMYATAEDVSDVLCDPDMTKPDDVLVWDDGEIPDGVMEALTRKGD
jgi:hypothetical protein